MRKEAPKSYGYGIFFLCFGILILIFINNFFILNKCYEFIFMVIGILAAIIGIIIIIKTELGILKNGKE